jgi:hypothetical protein
MSESIRLGREASAIFETEVAEVAADPEAHGLDLTDPQDGQEIDMYILADRLYKEAPKGRILKPKYRDEADLLWRLSTDLSNSADYLADPQTGPPDADERRRNRNAAKQLNTWGSKMLKFYPERPSQSFKPPAIMTFEEWRKGKEPLTPAQRRKVDRKAKELFAVGHATFTSPGPGFMRRHAGSFERKPGKDIYVEYRIINPTSEDEAQEWTDYSSISKLKNETLLYPGVQLEVQWHELGSKEDGFRGQNLIDRQIYTVEPDWYETPKKKADSGPEGIDPLDDDEDGWQAVGADMFPWMSQ